MTKKKEQRDPAVVVEPMYAALGDAQRKPRVNGVGWRIALAVVIAGFLLALVLKQAF